MDEKSSKKLASAGEVFRVYWKHLRRYPGLLSLIIIGAITLQVANLAAPLFMRQFFNLLVKGGTTPENVRMLIATLGLVISMWLLDWASRRVQDLSNMYMESRVMADLYDHAFSYLMGHSYNFFITRFAGSLTHKVTKFVRSLEILFDSIMLQFAPTFLFVVGAIIVLYIRNHVLGIALLVWTIIFIFFQIYVSIKRQHIRVARAEAETRGTGALADAISNQSNITLFSGTQFERKLFGTFIETWRIATLRSWISDSWIWGGIGLFMLLIEGGLLYGAIIYWQEGLLTIGDFVLIQGYLLTTFDRLVSINRELRRFYDAFADASEMVYMLELPHEIQDLPHAPILKVQKGEVAFKNMIFYFHETRSIFENFNLTIAPREKVALVGPSGAGKSTIVKLLLRLYDVAGGSIEIDGQNIAQSTQESLRNAIAFVPQEPILFHRTLMENIRYGKRDATDEEIIEAAKKAHCHEFISEFPEGYETYVGERGVRLSGGERQRVAIARAILKNAPILVLDEATSSLDSESESFIQDALENLMREKTVIVIAHRLSTIMKMDRIVVIENGKVIAQGKHSELLEQEGLYKKLWSIQAGGFLQDDGTEEATSVREEEILEDLEA